MSMSTSKSFASIVEGIEARARKARAVPRPSPQQLPLWRDHLRGLPNAMARSALFTCANHRTPRADFKRAKIVTVAGYEIYYTGEELRQDDEDVFLQIIHFARMRPLGDVVEITGSALLRALGWNSGAKSYSRVRDIIERLQATSLKIAQESGKAGYVGSLVRKFAWQSGEQDEAQAVGRTKWKIYLEKEIVSLFADDAYTLLDWADRVKLGPLSKWLHSFYYSHREPVPYKVATIRNLCGSKSSDLPGFRRDLKKALDELKEVGFIKSWAHSVETDTIMVVRNHQPSLR